MSKSPDAFRTISEVADWLGVQAHVLRFWESKFSQVKPVKRAGGRRYYRPSDMLLLGGIKRLLHDDGLTIKGVQKILREQGVAHVSGLSHPIEAALGVEPEKTGGTVLEFKSRPPAAAPAAPQPPAPTEHPGLEPEPQGAPAQAAPEPDIGPDVPAGALPGFLQPPAAAPRATGPGDAAPTPPPAAAATPRPRVVDAPDPPPDSAIPYTPGPLAHLAGLTRLSPRIAARIAPLARDLRLWHDRRAGAENG